MSTVPVNYLAKASTVHAYHMFALDRLLISSHLRDLSHNQGFSWCAPHLRAGSGVLQPPDSPHAPRRRFSNADRALRRRCPICRCRRPDTVSPRPHSGIRGRSVRRRNSLPYRAAGEAVLRTIGQAPARDPEPDESEPDSPPARSDERETSESRFLAEDSARTIRS